MTIDLYASAGRGVIVGVSVRVGADIEVGATVGGSDCAVTGREEGLLSAPPQPNRDSSNTIASIPDLITKAFKKMVKEVGMPHLTPHGLRHQYATAAREAGVDMGIISKNMGHASVAIIEDIYAHITANVMEEAALQRFTAREGHGRPPFSHK